MKYYEEKFFFFAPLPERKQFQQHTIFINAVEIFSFSASGCWLCFLAALAALGLPWWLTVLVIVLDSEPSGLPDQTPTSQNWWGSWENMTWPTKRQRQRQRQWQIHLENTFKERSLKLFTFETFDQSDGETWTYFSYVPLLVPPLFHFVPPIWGVHNPLMAYVPKYGHFWAVFGHKSALNGWNKVWSNWHTVYPTPPDQIQSLVLSN